MYQNFETLNDLIEYLQELAEQETVGGMSVGELPVAIAHQQSWPLAERVSAVTVADRDGMKVWLAASPGHGMDMAQAVRNADRTEGRRESEWLANFLGWFLIHGPYTANVEFEPFGCQHADLEYLYVVDGIVDLRWGKTKSGRLPITISVYGMGCDENYSDAEKREPIFSGTAYEYIERFGKEQ